MTTVQINVNGQQLILDIDHAKKLDEKTFVKLYGDLFENVQSDAFKELQNVIGKTDVKKG